MSCFVKNPNLPENNVRCVVCGELCTELNDYLDSKGIERLVMAPNADIDPAVKFHADMAVLYLGDGKVIVDKNQKSLIAGLESLGLSVYLTERNIAGEYPEDIALNFTLISNKILGHFKYADNILLDCAEKLTRINVRQGYCKCSCLVIDANSLITDDKSIYDKAAENGLECLLIAKGDIVLSGHEYGFIGGASAKISKDEVLFFGDITKHRDYKKIAVFLEKHGCKIISLNFPLTDFGGIIPITEKAP